VIEFLKFLVIAGLIIGVNKGIGALCRICAKRWDLDQKVLTQVVMIVSFLAASYLWLFTGFYRWLSSIIGFPLEK
jgi:hypothetical protein